MTLYLVNDMSATTIDQRTRIHEGRCEDDDRPSPRSTSPRPTHQAMKAAKDREEGRNQSTELYDPPVISSKEGDQQQSSPSKLSSVTTQFDQADDNDDSDSLDCLEQTQLGEDSNVPFITDIHETTRLRTQDNNLPAMSLFVDSIESIFNVIPIVDGWKNWLWGSQYEKLLPVTSTKGMGWRKLEGREYESVAWGFEYREGRGSSNANGKG